MKLPQPTIAWVGGAAAVGKTSVMRDVIKTIDNAVLIEKDIALEHFLHANPFKLAKPDGTIDEDTRLSFSSPEYARHFRDQVYASMFAQALALASQGKSSFLDANYIGWLTGANGGKDGRISLARRVVNMYDDVQKNPGPLRDAIPNLDEFRMTTLFFYVTDPNVVRERMVNRMALDPAAKDRDFSKVATDEAWAKQLEREPVTYLQQLNQYSDLLAIDLTEPYAGRSRKRVKSDIREFLSIPAVLSDTGIFKDESLDETFMRYR